MILRDPELYGKMRLIIGRSPVQVWVGPPFKSSITHIAVAAAHPSFTLTPLAQYFLRNTKLTDRTLTAPMILPLQHP